MKCFIVLLLTFCLSQSKERQSFKNITTRKSETFDENASKRTVGPYHNAMDWILAANSHRLRESNKIKRTDIAGKNDSVEDEIISINTGEKTENDLLEGDIILNPMEVEDQKLIKLREENKDGLVEDELSKRQATRKMKMLWHTRRVPYLIHSNLYTVRDVILRAIAKFNTKSCVQFVPRQGSERDFVLFEKNDGCFSRIGRAYSQPGQQIISIGEFCDRESIIMHEMLHSIGFYHEQSRPDRDKFLEIRWNNIGKGFESQFLSYGHGDIDEYGINYNYDSLMQYGRTAFSAFGKNTMEAIGHPENELGSEHMTKEDVFELNTLYDCKSKTFNAWTQWSSFGPCDSHCYKTRQRYCYGMTHSSCGKANEYGIDDQRVKCPPTECPVKINGNWGRWSPWGLCSRNCNEGVQNRQRTCDDPKPANNGASCPHSDKDYKICIKPRCTLENEDEDFRSGQLGRVWQNYAYDTPGLDWEVWKGETKTEGTGPSSDHLGDVNGYYLYVESSDRKQNDNARLLSKMMKPTEKEKRCLKFFYHMFGRTTGTLSVIIYPEIPEKPRRLFSVSGPQGNKWNLASVTLHSKAQFQLVIEAVIGPNHSDIAIDDIFIDEGDCDCQDHYVSCKTWAKNGDCVNSYDFMLIHCSKSCNMCGCKDKNKNCHLWSKQGQCKVNAGYMEVMCPLTCRVCACHDDEIKCILWVKQGECKKNKKYMSLFCKKSCKFC